MRKTFHHKYIQVKDWYERYERRISTFSLLFGFVFDSLTLQRIDALRENLWITLNLLVVGVCIILLNRRGGRDPRSHFWFFTILQFSFGSILGAFFIFYFQSATLAVSWPFLAMLLAAMVGNEVLKKHYERLIFQLSFFYLSVFVFAIFLLPVVTHRLGAWIFLLSGVVSLVVIWGFVRLLRRFAADSLEGNSGRVRMAVASIFLAINLLYFTNLIPPIPLSLKDSGIYHSIERNADGSYAVKEEKESDFLRYFRLRREIHLPPGDNLFAYSAIFSPASLDTNIVHEWQHFDENQGEWVTVTRIPLRLSGGRAEGFRTFSTKTNLIPGLWRVNVATPRGAIIGRINFRLFSSQSAPTLITSVKN